MKYLYFLLVCFVWAGCSSSEETLSKPQVSVYVMGMHEMYQIAYWKDGKKYPMEDEGVFSATTDIAVSNGNVYVSGYTGDGYRNVACYWKDGKQHIIGNATDTTYAQAIAVSGNDVYVTGYQLTEDGINGVYWKNGVIHVLNSGSNQSFASDIALSGNDVYVSGTIMSDIPDEYYPRYQAAYWKNGVLKLLPDAATESMATSIAVENANVYVAGHNITGGGPTGRKVLYWKNTEQHELTPVSSPSEYYIDVNGIAVENGQVYISGREFNYSRSEPDKGVYWINNKATSITSKSKNVSLLDIAVFEGEVFTTGMNDNQGAYWWNKKRLTLEGNQPFPSGITVVSNNK